MRDSLIKEGLFSFTYVQYTLECKELKTSTIRKLSDIEWFREKLKALYPTSYFPPLPKKSMFEKTDKTDAERKIATLNRFFASLLQSEVIRSAPLTKDFIILSQSDFEKKKKGVYDKIKGPDQIKEFVTMDGYVDIKIDKNVERKVIAMNTDLSSKISAYDNLLFKLSELIGLFESVSQKINEISSAFTQLSRAYKDKINSNTIVECFDKFTTFANKWKEGYDNQIVFFRDDIRSFFKYINKELTEFKPLYDEYYAGKSDYEEKNYNLDKNKNNPLKVEECKKDFVNSRTCYGFVLNRIYDEYFRLNGYHGKIISQKLDEMDENKQTILHDYFSLIQILGLK